MGGDARARVPENLIVNVSVTVRTPKVIFLNPPIRQVSSSKVMIPLTKPQSHRRHAEHHVQVLADQKGFTVRLTKPLAAQEKHLRHRLPRAKLAQVVQVLRQIRRRHADHHVQVLARSRPAGFYLQ